MSKKRKRGLGGSEGKQENKRKNTLFFYCIHPKIDTLYEQ